MQERFGVAAGLCHTLIDQCARCLERNTIALQFLVERIARILRVDLGGHLGEGGIDLFGGAHAVEQPVGDMLALDA